MQYINLHFLLHNRAFFLRVQYRIMIMIGLFIIEFAYLLFIPMSNTYPKLSEYITEGYIDCKIVLFHAVGDSLNNSTMAVGCRNQQLSWCNRVPQILLPKFVAGMLLVTFGYSASVLPNYTLYSRILGPFPQVILPLCFGVTHPSSAGHDDGSSHCCR